MSPINRFILSAGLLCFFLSFACHHVLAQPQLERGPQDAVVHEGDTVKFVCDLTNVIGYSVYWLYRSQGGFVRYLSIDRSVIANPPLPPQLEQRLSIIGNESQDEFTLRITNVQETDEGTYSCRYGYLGRNVETAGTADLMVQVPPSTQSPWCSVQPESRAVGDYGTLYCNSQAGKPTPNITYYKENEQLVGPVTNSIRHQYQLKAQDNGVIFTCIMTTPALDESRNCSVMPLRILPQATIRPAVSGVEEGTFTTFQCSGEGVPNITNYSWKVIDTETGQILPTERCTVSEDGQTLEIAVMENLELVCTVSVPSGLSGNTTTRIDVVNREQTTMSVVSTGLHTDKPSKEPPCNCPKNEQSSPVTVVLIVAVVVLAVAVIVLNILLVWQRKHYRKSTSPPAGPKMTRAGHEYDDVQDAAEQGQEMQDSAYAAVQEDRDGPITSEYLELQDSPTCKESL
ncbi:neural cell adhesion molecule 1-like [Patiria miniata]|uniref:Ig-like domain-containing protein n=1 Tax=Patiria miniata TaxID=46514 RepID=A0A914BJF8_PATMI|nr:neural cell adhesion molecule 1-like [Patiria miniata]